MTAAVPAHSSVVGGSNAQRVLACPASVKTIRAVPPELVKESSIYADEGTALHSCVARMLCEDLHPHDFVDAAIKLDSGVEIAITKELAADCLVPVREFFDAEIADVDEFWLELRSEFPGVPGAFGTSDFAGRGRERLVFADWKFGAGVAVAATYPDPDELALEIINAQLLFYICNLRHAMPDLFNAGLPIDAYIVQPRHQNPDQRVTVARGIRGEELDAFEVALRAAVDAAFTADPPRRRGAHCRFAPCRAICPAHTGPLLDLARMQTLQRPNNVAIAFGKLSAYGETLAAGLELAEIAEPLIRELRSQSHAFLSDHYPVPGWKLVGKRAVRRWADAEVARKTLLKSGFAAADIFEEPALRSPAQIEKAAKLAGLPLPDLEIVAASSGSTLARATDDRPPVPDRDAAINSFARAIATLKEHADGQ